MSKYQIFSGGSNQELAKKISDYLGQPLGNMSIKVNPDGEVVVKIAENVKRQEVFLIQSIVSCKGRSVNDNMIELFLMIDAAKRSGAARVTVVIPYFGYFAQKKKEAERVPLPARLFAGLLEKAGIDSVITIDCKEKVEELFACRVLPLFARQILLETIKDEIIRKQTDEVVIVASDKTGVELSEGYAKRLGKGLALVNFRFSHKEGKEKMELLGDVSGKVVVILKDIVNTAVSLCDAAAFLKNQGAKAVHACVVHPVFSGNSVQQLNDSVIESVIVSDSIPLSEEAKASSKIFQESVAKILGEGIMREYRGDATNPLY